MHIHVTLFIKWPYIWNLRPIPNNYTNLSGYNDDKGAFIPEHTTVKRFQAVLDGKKSLTISKSPRHNRLAGILQ